MDRRVLFAAAAIAVIAVVVLASGYVVGSGGIFGNRGNSTSSQTSLKGLNATSVGLVVESATLTETSTSSNATFTLFVANLGNFTFSDVKVSLVVTHYRNTTVPMDTTTMAPHDVANGQASLGVSCDTRVLYPYTIEWAISGVQFSKLFAVNCALA